MNYLRRLQAEQPVLFWVLVALGLFLGFQLVLSVVGLLLGPFGLLSWVPIVVVVGPSSPPAATGAPGDAPAKVRSWPRSFLTTCRDASSPAGALAVPCSRLVTDRE